MSVARVIRNSLSERDPFLEPDLTGADLHGTHLVLAKVSRADLSSTDPSEAHLLWTDLS
jgi:uncharacterized protein YjbI with pentapeptide repeats